MGQYHILANLTKKEFVVPSGFGFGHKQAEHLDGMGRILYILTMIPSCRGGGDVFSEEMSVSSVFIGRWLGDRIAVVGDYSCDEDLPDFPEFGSVYSSCMSNANPLYDCFGFGIKNSKRTGLWMDITADLVIEVEELLNTKIIAMGHPTLWPDGTPKPEFMVEQAKHARRILRENKNGQHTF